MEETDDAILVLTGRLADRRFGEDLHTMEAHIRISVVEGAILGLTHYARHPHHGMRGGPAVQGLEGVVINRVSPTPSNRWWVPKGAAPTWPA